MEQEAAARHSMQQEAAARHSNYLCVPEYVFNIFFVLPLFWPFLMITKKARNLVPETGFPTSVFRGETQ